MYNAEIPTDIKNEVDKYKKCKQNSLSIVLTTTIFITLELYIIKHKLENFSMNRLFIRHW